MKFKADSNVDEAVSKLEDFRPNLLRESAAILNSDLEVINRQQKNNIPVRTGRLRDSAFVERARRRGNAVEGAVGASIFYARFVHEKPGGKGWKFLEREVAAREDRMDKNQELAGLKAARKL